MKNTLSLVILFALFNSCSPDKNVARRDFFKKDGLSIERGRVIAWFPKDSVSEQRMNDVVDTLNLGIAMAEKFIGSPREWQLFNGKKITYYFSPGPFFIAHASKEGDIFIPFIRLKKNTVPWLHETMHILLRSKKGNWNNKSQVASYFYMPQWFIEGIAEYTAVKISYDHKIPKVDLFKSGGYATVDSVCHVNLQKENGSAILEYIGKAGAPRELGGDKRAAFAPTFYNCSCSFTKYIAETYGLETILTAVSEFENEHETIEKLTHKSMEELKKEWMSQLSKIQ